MRVVVSTSIAMIVVCRALTLKDASLLQRTTAEPVPAKFLTSCIWTTPRAAVLSWTSRISDVSVVPPASSVQTTSPSAEPVEDTSVDFAVNTYEPAGMLDIVATVWFTPCGRFWSPVR